MQLSFNDFFNPVFVKELRETLHRKSTCFFLIGLVFWEILLFCIASAMRDIPGGRPDGELLPLITLAAGLCLFGVCGVTPLRHFAAERKDPDQDYTLFSLLKPHQVIAGKFFAAMLMGVVILLLSCPLMIHEATERGITIGNLVCTCLYFLPTLALLLLSGLWLGSCTRKGGLIAFLLLWFQFGIPLVVGLDLLNEERPGGWSSGIIAAEYIILFLCVFLFCLSCAAIAPRKSNRYQAAKIVLWVNFFTAPLISFLPVKMPVGGTWETLFALNALAEIFFFALLSVPVSLEPGKRIAENAPRNRIFRLFYFLTSDHAAGAVLCCALALFLLSIVAWGKVSGGNDHCIWKACNAVGGYIVFYTILALFLRKFFKNLSAGTALLFVFTALGALPCLFSVLQLRGGNYYWLWVTSPLFAGAGPLSLRDSMGPLWALAAFLCYLPSIIRSFRRS